MFTFSTDWILLVAAWYEIEVADDDDDDVAAILFHSIIITQRTHFRLFAGWSGHNTKK